MALSDIQVRQLRAKLEADGEITAEMLDETDEIDEY